MKDYINTSQTDAIATLELQVTHWMQRETKLSPKSIKNYTQAIRKIARDIYLNESLPSVALGACSTDELTELKKRYFAVPEFKELDARGKGMYSAAFNKLILIQQTKKKHVTGSYKEWKEGRADSFMVKIGSIGGRRI